MKITHTSFPVNLRWQPITLNALKQRKSYMWKLRNLYKW